MKIDYPKESNAFKTICVFEHAFPALDWRTYSRPDLYGCSAYLGPLRIDICHASVGWRADVKGIGERENLTAFAPSRVELIEPLREKLAALRDDIGRVLSAMDLP